MNIFTETWEIYMKIYVTKTEYERKHFQVAT